MNILATIRNLRSVSARGALAVAMVAWLGFLLQPCVMAAPLAGTADDANRVELSIVTHHDASIPAEQCLHCDDYGDALPAGCDDIAAPGNPAAAKPLDSGADGGSAVVTAVFPDVRQITAGPVEPLQAEHLPPPVAFTEAYCVYLE
jgi:hypothetical protein